MAYVYTCQTVKSYWVQAAEPDILMCVCIVMLEECEWATTSACDIYRALWRPQMAGREG